MNKSSIFQSESQKEADAAAKAVQVKYSNIQTPILSIDESIAAGRELPIKKGEIIYGDPDGKYWIYLC